MREITCYSHRFHIIPPYTRSATVRPPHQLTLRKGGIPMEDYEEMASTRLNQPPAPRERGRRWLLIGGLAFALLLALGIGMLMGSLTGSAQAATIAPGSSNSSLSLADAQGNASSAQPLVIAQGTQGTGGQCDALTVSSVNGNTIVAKTSSGSTITIHTTASTQYTQAGKTVHAGAINVGTRIPVTGTHNSDGSITGTRIALGWYRA